MISMSQAGRLTGQGKSNTMNLYLRSRAPLRLWLAGVLTAVGIATAGNAADGSTLWSKSYGGVYSVNPPAIDGGTVYLQVGNWDTDTHLYAYSAASGTELHDGPFSAHAHRRCR